MKDIPALDNVPLLGRHGAMESLFGKFLLACWAFAISFVFYHILRSLDGRTSELFETVERLEHEIQERERTEQLLRESEQRFRGIFESEPECVKLLDPEGNLLDMNPAGLKMLEVDSINEVRGQCIYPIIMDEYRNEFIAASEAVFRGESIVLQFEILGLRGTRRWMESHQVPIRNAQGRITTLLAVTHDISERKQAEKEIQDKDQKLEDLLSNVDAIILEGDPFDFNYIGGQVEKILGYPKEMWFDHPDGPGGFWISILHKDDIEKVGTCRTAVERGENHSFEYRLTAADGKHIWFFDTVTVETENGKPVKTRCVMIDITDRKRAEQDREKLIEELENRNAEMERFTYTVSHDLKSPLITIKGFLGMLEEDMKKENHSGVESDMSRISGAADRMVQLLDELLELSRVSRVVNLHQDVSLTDLAADAIELCATQISEAGIQIKISSDLPVVHGDQVRLQEVLQNLIDNAVKFTRNQPQPRIEIGTRQDDGEVICYVRDNGTGIDSRYHEKIFDLFEQLDPQKDGTGIGLAIVKRIIDVHGGRIWVESEGIGKGSVFCFTIPDTIAEERSSLSIRSD
jgi:PAS domain S-box-containing protein